MSSFVLVPGAGGAASYWGRVGPLLQAAGHDVVAVTLPAADPDAGLAEYADIVVEAIGERTDVILVGQSMGGFTVAMAAVRAPLSSIVLVNAMIPNPGEKAGEWGDHTGSTHAREAAAEVGGYGPFAMDRYFFHDVPDDVLAGTADDQQDESEAAFASTCAFDAWPDIQIRVLAGADDRLFPIDFQRRVARERLGVEADVLPGGHLIALAHPESVAGYLLGD